MTASELSDDPTHQPAPLRMDVFDEEDRGPSCRPVSAIWLCWSRAGWSHSPEGGRGAHLALRQARRADAVPLVVHVSQVPALVAALPEASLRLTQHWERNGREYGAGQPEPGGTGPQDPGSRTLEAERAEVEPDRDEARRARRRAKA